MGMRVWTGLAHCRSLCSLVLEDELVEGGEGGESGRGWHGPGPKGRAQDKREGQAHTCALEDPHSISNSL